MSSIKNIRMAINALRNSINGEGVKTSIERLDELEVELKSFNHEFVRAQQSTSFPRLNSRKDKLFNAIKNNLTKKEKEVDVLKNKVEQFKPMQDSLNYLTAYNGKLLRKLKRLENKK